MESLYRHLWIYDLEDKIEYPSERYVNDIILKHRDIRSKIINILISEVPKSQMNSVGLAISIFDLYCSKTSYFDSFKSENEHVAIFACFHLATYVTNGDDEFILNHPYISSHIMEATIDEVFTVINNAIIRPFIFIQNPINIDDIKFDEYNGKNKKEIKDVLKIAITERHKLALISYHIPKLIRCKPSHIVHAILIMTRYLFVTDEKYIPDKIIYWICCVIIKELNRRFIHHQYDLNNFTEDSSFINEGMVYNNIIERPLIMNIDPTGVRFNKKNYTERGKIEYISVFTKGKEQNIAVKKVDNDYIARYLEISILQHLSSPYVISLYGSEIRSYHTYLYMPLGKYDLMTMVEKNQLPIEKVRTYMYQIIQGLHHIHENCIIHRDIKAENIVYFADEDVMKIIDFGISAPFSHFNSVFSDYIIAPDGEEYNFTYNDRYLSSDMACTLNYRAPEALLNINYDHKIDIWAVGMVFYFMVTKRLLISKTYLSDMDILYLIFTKLGLPDENTWPGITTIPMWQSFKLKLDQQPIQFINQINKINHIDIIGSCLVLNPNYRANTAYLLELYH